MHQYGSDPHASDRLEKLTARKRELTEMLYKRDNNINSEEPVTDEKEKVAKANKILQNPTEDKRYYISENSVRFRR